MTNIGSSLRDKYTQLTETVTDGGGLGDVDGGEHIDTIARSTANSADSRSLENRNLIDITLGMANTNAADIAGNTSQLDAISDVVANTPLVQVIKDSGRGIGGLEPYGVGCSDTFNSENWKPYASSGSVLGLTSKFRHNNSSGGGVEPALDPIMLDLLTAMGRTSISAIRYGTEFHIFQTVMDAAPSGGLQVYNGINYFLGSLKASDFTGPAGFMTNAGWLYSDNDNDLMVRAVGGLPSKIYINGVEQPSDFAQIPAGWNHVCWQVGAALGYTTSLAVYAIAGIDYWAGLPVLVRARQQVPVHTAPIIYQ